MKLVIVTIAAALLGCGQPQQDGATTKKLTATEYKQHADKKGVLVDVRTPEEYAGGALKDAKNVDYKSGAFAEEIKNWDKNKTYYLYCASGNRSGKAAQVMQEAGFKNVYNIGGFQELKSAGLPTKK